jgi:superfamily I DNA and/or RNA helicase
MSKRRYQMNASDKSFDENYVTQLLDNFRSHHAILQFSNVLFYSGKLRAKVNEADKLFGTRWNYLKNQQFPIVFHCVTTPSEIIRNGTSSFNDGELEKVRFYVKMLLKQGIDGEKVTEEDIGIVSPYKAQLIKLREEFRREPKLEIGTTEYYQGREKKIIIVSTVKSGDTVGFLKSEKRLNVCFTRAKSLLIVIGNAETLQVSSWREFVVNSLTLFEIPAKLNVAIIHPVLQDQRRLLR